ncbi:hypothetical protein Atai01_15480 [Amycolatopsis taiwanensis]|uniref:Uncharacterized protein n=1 Tax=Amycolatopsis taiwanensis TaxID=342230 RepID=A0A9W6VFJ6_9PSEU|nr:hypothetical protein Atai01_15480 [Amycolatopsis taiwanensis]
MTESSADRACSAHAAVSTGVLTTGASIAGSDTGIEVGSAETNTAIPAAPSAKAAPMVPTLFRSARGG